MKVRPQATSAMKTNPRGMNWRNGAPATIDNLVGPNARLGPTSKIRYLRVRTNAITAWMSAVDIFFP